MKKASKVPVKTKILVTGDLIRDYHIIKYPVHPAGYRDSLTSTVIKTQKGGAWYLADFIRLIHEGSSADIHTPDYPEDKPTQLLIHNAYQVWSKGQKDPDGQKKSVWRIENFLGCEKIEDKEKKFALPFPYDDNFIPDMLVIDDVGLGFVNDVLTVNALLENIVNVKNILIKTHSRLVDSLLWAQLTEKGLLKKTTVIIPADSLRESGANITRGYSWDKTIEETAREFHSGQSSIDFCQCKRVVVLFDKYGIASFSSEPMELKFKGAKDTGDKLTFEKFTYDRQNYEGASDDKGNIYGSLSMLTAAVTLLYAEKKFSMSYINKLALNCIQKNIELTGGSGEKPGTEEMNDFFSFAFSQKSKSEKTETKEDIKRKYVLSDEFFSAFPSYNDQLNYGLKEEKGKFKSNLLSDAAGDGEHYLYAKAVEIIMRGPDKALKQVPVARFEKYQTYDREEIERINAVKNLINVYRSHPSDKRPLSFAVFGAPGSGKSFAIKQLLASIFGSSNEPVVFNLTQFQNISDLHHALHIVRDRTVKGAMPLIFWDEFDCNNNTWLKEFLAPMQDGEFSEGGANHPIGKAIFVFAGGTRPTFEIYETETLTQVLLKGPDFISRLRGFINIKGPNNTAEKGNDEKKNSEEAETRDKTHEKDEAYIIRRAIQIHENLKKHHALIFEKNNMPSISPGVLNALLRTKKYLHGARSIESIIALSRSGTNRHFSASSLPSPELLKIHATNDFADLVEKGELEFPLIEILAEVIHNEWKKAKEHPTIEANHPYIYGAERKDGPEEYTHPRLMDYQQLKEEWKEDNRMTARLTKAKFATLGFEIISPCSKESTELEIETVVNERRKELMEKEHDIWLRSHLIEGWEYNAITQDDILLHKDIASMSAMSSTEKQLDNAIINATLDVLRKNKYKLRKI